MAPATPLPLVKTQAFGNDFLLVDRAAVPEGQDGPALARAVCDRHRGIGADGLMFMEATADGARTQLLNADGSRAEVSGNGVRCAAAWLASERKLPVGGRVVIGTTAGPKPLDLLASAGHTFTFRANMGAPTELREETIDDEGAPTRCVVLRVGNPQCVVLGPVTEERLHGLGRRYGCCCSECRS